MKIAQTREFEKEARRGLTVGKQDTAIVANCHNLEANERAQFIKLVVQSSCEASQNKHF